MPKKNIPSGTKHVFDDVGEEVTWHSRYDREDISPAEVAIALRERIKELDCLYTISKLRDLHYHSSERFLQGVADYLPRSWQYPEYCCARITLGDKKFATAGFREDVWRISSAIHVEGKPAGIVEVFYRKDVPIIGEDPFLKEEYALISEVADRIGNVLLHIKTEGDLREAHKTLQRQHQMLQETNIALRAVLSRLEEDKREIRASILSNIQKIIMPIVFELELEVTGRQRSYVTLLRQNLQEIASPFLTQMTRTHMELTPVEIAISTMIRSGLSTKEIAQLRCISPATVRRHRENIRKKLNLKNRRINLVTYLQSSSAEDKAAGDLSYGETSEENSDVPKRTRQQTEKNENSL